MLNRITVVSCFALALAACGPGEKIQSGKQGAAEALYAASGSTKTGADRLSQPLVTTDVSIACQLGGTAKLSGFQAVTNTGLGQGGAFDIGQSFTVNFDHCAAASTSSGSGKAELNGKVDVTQAIDLAVGSASVLQKIKGHIDYQGAMNDFIDADVTQSVNATALSLTSGGVSLNLNGTLADSSGSYTYATADSLTVNAGTIDVQVTASSH
ncbi:MAG: hypothetical protein QM723_35525 [Myxococcaceae bacterium]